jgi:hypothetical protein
METLAVKAEGRFKIGEDELTVFILENGKRAVSQSDVYYLFTKKRAKQGARYFLSLSNLKKHLPPRLLKKDNVRVIHNGAETLIFFSQELVALCKGIVIAGFNDDLSQSWQAALKKSQLLLIDFAINGVDASIDKTIRSSPVMSRTHFDKVITSLLLAR